jgi:hypothetical protein
VRIMSTGHDCERVYHYDRETADVRATLSPGRRNNYLNSED